MSDREEPGNCRWATAAEQTRNTRRNRNYTFNGETLCQKDWADRLHCSPETLARRLKQGWSLERTLATPVLRRPKLSPEERRAYHRAWEARNRDHLRACRLRRKRAVQQSTEAA